MSIQQICIPDIGDVEEVEVIELCVAEGDRVDVDDALIVIESDKASMEVPSTHAGKVVSLKVAVGDTCKEGDLIAEVELDDAAEAGGEEESEPDDSAGEERVSEPVVSESSPAPEEGGETEPEGASEVIEVRVPDVGDASDVVVVEVMVAAGDQVGADDGLVALESDKATMEIPAPRAGRIVSIEVADGDQVKEGTLIARIEVEGAAGEPARKQPPAKAEAAEQERKPAEKKPPEPVPAEPEAAGEGALVYAGPAVRQLARELGVDLTRVGGSGNKGRILKEDVHAHVKARMQAPEAGGAGIPPIPEVDFSRFGDVEFEPLSRIMRTGAANLHRSWLNLPHVTQHDEADVTGLEALRRELKAEAEREGVKLTPLPFIMKAVQAALVQFPRFNGSFAGDGERYVLKRYFHIGFAVDTPEGLLVPVVRDVDRKGIYALAREIADLSERARALKLKPDEMRGGCISISSLGNIGGTGFTPIVNAPEVAILGVSRLTRKPVWDGDAFVPRDVLPLSLSYDHRAINGAEAGRFMTWLCQTLSDLRRVLL